MAKIGRCRDFGHFRENNEIIRPVSVGVRVQGRGERETRGAPSAQRVVEEGYVIDRGMGSSHLSENDLLSGQLVDQDSRFR